MRVKTIKHTDCIEVGHDKFDEVVSNLLARTGESNIISITTLTYTHLDIGRLTEVYDKAHPRARAATPPPPAKPSDGDE